MTPSSSAGRPLVAHSPALYARLPVRASAYVTDYLRTDTSAYLNKYVYTWVHLQPGGLVSSRSYLELIGVDSELLTRHPAHIPVFLQGREHPRRLRYAHERGGRVAHSLKWAFGTSVRSTRKALAWRPRGATVRACTRHVMSCQALRRPPTLGSVSFAALTIHHGVILHLRLLVSANT